MCYYFLKMALWRGSRRILLKKNTQVEISRRRALLNFQLNANRIIKIITNSPSRRDNLQYEIEIFHHTLQYNILKTASVKKIQKRNQCVRLLNFHQLALNVKAYTELYIAVQCLMILFHNFVLFILYRKLLEYQAIQLHITIHSSQSSLSTYFSIHHSQSSYQSMYDVEELSLSKNYNMAL